MDSYTIGISGLWYLPVILGIIGIAVALFTYRRTIPPVSRAKKIVLVALRSLALLTLLFVLLEPVINLIKGSEESPKLAVLLDNSLSAVQEDASGSRIDLYKRAYDNSNFESLGDENLNVFLFDSETKFLNKFDSDDFSADSIKHDGQLTDISSSLRRILRNKEDQNIKAALLLTDGAFNSGDNPVYDADVAGMPVFVIGIGDSSQAKDVFIKSVLTNEIAYIENPIPVNINVSAADYGQGELTVKLSDNGTLVKEEKFNIYPERNDYSIVMEYMPKVEGMHKLTASVSSMEGEITLKNNALSEYVKVLKNKRKITILAGAPSSDLSFLKTALKKEKGVEIKSFVQQKGSVFYGSPPTQKDISESELLIFVGFPIGSSPQNVIQMAKKALENGKPLFFIASQSTDYGKLRQLEEYLPFNTISSKPNEFLALPDIKAKAVSSPLLKIDGSEKDIDFWNSLPPLYRTETFVNIKPGTELISTIKVNNAPLHEPLILSRSFRNNKTVIVMGYGLYRWKMMGFASEIAKGREDAKDLYDIFVSNCIRWLSVKQDQKNIRIKTTKKHYTNAENVEVSAQVYDKAYVPVDNAIVNVKVRGGEEVRELTLTTLGNGRYQGVFEGLPENDYFLSGEVQKNDVKLGKDNGRFSVGSIDLEYLNLRMNSKLLRSIAERTGGKFYMPDEAASFINDLKHHSSFKPRALTQRSEIALWNLPWLLGFAILCFAIEWYLRKKYGMV